MKITRLPLPVLALLALLLTAAGFALWSPLTQGEESLIQRRYAEAATHLEKAVAEGPAAQRDRALLLLGRARLLAGDAQGAIRAFETLVDEESGSGFRSMARFQQAEALARSGAHREAARIYRDEIARLIGMDRKERIAATYLALAEQARGAETPDHARAVTFFDLALDLGLSEGRARTVRLLAADSLAQVGQHQQTVTRLEGLLEDLTADTGLRRAMLILGRSKAMLGDGAGARKVLRDLRRDHSDSAEAADAAFEIARTYGVPTPQPNMLDRAVAALEELRERYPEHPKARLARFLMAQSQRACGRTEAALKSLAAFVAQGDADLEEVAAARAMVGDILSSQNRRQEAIAAWREYLSAHPSHSDWERVQRAIVDAEWALAMEAHADGLEGYAAARERFDRFASDYPLDARNPQILLLRGDMLAAEDKHEDAVVAYARCVSKYPGRDESSRAQFRIGEIREGVLFHYEKALEAYRAVTWGSWAGRARERVQRLEQKFLALRTERIFRTDEEPAFEIRSRNIESLRVRVFRLDLADYFRATHTAGDVERLDIEIIAPDVVFDSAVVDYQKYREFVRNVPIASNGPGAYVVKVDDRELEATTMVLVSDIAMIAKSSRHEFFVFTQNTQAQRVEAGVKVVLSDGQRIVAEGATDAQGVWRYDGEALAQHDRLRVFCVGASGSGASNIDLSGLGYRQGLSPKGYLFTDRPVYRAGETVHCKGIVREVEGGLYRLPSEQGYRMQILAADGRLVREEDIEFSEFGSFDAALVIPEDPSFGSWTFAVTARGEQRFSSTFQVSEYERPRLSLTAELDEPVVLRGEAIAGRLVARYFYGEPAVGKTVSYSVGLPDGGILQRQGVTNAAGEVAFEVETGDFAEESVAVISARVVGTNASIQAMVPVVTTEFSPRVTTVRDVYLSGETLRAEVSLSDRAGKPVARSGEVVLLRLVNGPRGVAEVEVARKPFRSDAQGKAEVAFELAEGGAHRLRVEAVDRFENVVTATRDVTVSGEDDEVKLRLLADRDRFEVGDEATVTVVNRAGPRLVLETVQGDGILAHRSYVLAQGTTQIQLPLATLHAPNFALALAMVDGNQLHAAEREFRVERDLRVSVTPEAEAIEPGATGRFRVEVKDPQGRPVAAELAVAMVDDALLALFGDATPEIGGFFYGELRETGFRTRSSCTWSYSGAARGMSEALLAEERRREAEAAAGEPVADPEADGDAFFADRAVPGRAGGGGGPTSPAFGRGPATPGPGGGPAGPVTGAPRRSRADTQQGVTLLSEMAERHKDISMFGSLQQLRVQTATQEFEGGLARYAKLGFLVANTSMDAGLASLQDPRVRDVSGTGAWVAAVTTDAQGVGSFEITMPDSTTSWTLVARGVTADTWVGQGRAAVTTNLDLQVEFVGPMILTEGDELAYRARVHNTSGEAMAAAVEAAIVRGEQREERSERLELEPGAEGEFGVPIVAADSFSLEASARAGAAAADAARMSVGVQPFGLEYRDGASGHTRQQARFELGLPAERAYDNLRMQVSIGRDPAHELMRAVLGVSYRPTRCMVVEQTQLGMAARGEMALALLQALESGRGVTPAERSRLGAQVRGALASLIGRQQQDGSNGFTVRSGQDRTTTAAALRLFAAARRAGYREAEAAARRAADWLLGQLGRIKVESRADILWALAVEGRAGFEALNSLHRSRTGLQLADAARLALAWQAAGRPELSDEALEVVRARLGARRAVDNATDVEAVSLACRALLARDNTSRVGREALERVRAQRRGAAWATPTATAAAVTAILQATVWPSDGEVRAGTVRVTVNGEEVGVVAADAARSSVEFDVPSEWLEPAANVVELSVAGGATAHYTATLVGFSRGFDGDFASERDHQAVAVERRYLADVLRDGEQPVPRGFSVVTGRYESFRNLLTRMEVGASCRVEVDARVRWNRDEIHGGPLVVEEPLPAGCTVPRESISGGFEHVEVLPGRLLFYFAAGVARTSVSYELLGRFEGSFRVLPTRAYGALRPDLVGYSEPGSLRVDAVGEGDADPYRLTPDELYHLGTARFDRGDMKGAVELLSTLLTDWNRDKVELRADVFKQVARMMMFASIERGESAGVVRYFEQLKDRYPELSIPFDKILEVGKAYLDIGEFESALLVFRATAEASYLKDAAVATTLERMGELDKSVRFLQRLLMEYPDLNTMRMSLYGIAQQLAGWAVQRDPSTAPADPRVGSAAELRQSAVRAFREFLVFYPEDPLAEEVSFAWATTLLEGDDLQGALAVANAALARYPQSVFEDEFLYTKGYALFATGEHERAFEALRRVADGTFARPDGTRGESENRFHAIYLQGQIHHARGEAELALEKYDQVEDRFSDAGEASNYFERKALELPEVTSVGLDESVEVELGYRNIERVEVQVYKVDLMRLYLLEKSLNDIRGVQLHGIKPLVEKVVELGNGRDYRGKKRALALDLPDAGAYLLVVRGDDRLASGMVLRTDLELEVQEQTGAGRIRVNVKRGGAFLGGAHVKVVGSQDGEFHGGETDLRGVYTASGLIGKATVLASHEGQFAFLRGDQVHQPARYRLPAQQQVQHGEPPMPQKGQGFDALDNNFLMNGANRGRQVQWLEKQVKQVEQQGVEVYRTK